MLKTRLLQFYTDHKTVILNLLVALLFALLGIGGGVALEEAYPARLDLAQARPTESAPPTPTKPARETATATSVPTLVSTLTPSPVVTLAFTPTPPPVAGCDETQWHLPIDAPGCHHHHGVDVMNGVDPVSGKTYEEIFAVDGFSIRAWFTEQGIILQPASMTVNEDPRGRIYFYVHAKDNCEQDFEGFATPVPGEYACVTDVIYGVHAMGILAHLLGNGLSTHSEVWVAKVCAVDESTPILDGALK